MKTLLKFKILFLVIFSGILFSCKDNNKYPQESPNNVENSNDDNIVPHDNIDQNNVAPDTSGVNSGSATPGSGTDGAQQSNIQE